jgi:ketol-acid reductoisomerase
LLFGRNEKRKVSQIYDDVQSGRFSREWIGEVAEGSSRLRRKREEFLADPIHEVGARVRKLMGIQD